PPASGAGGREDERAAPSRPRGPGRRLPGPRLAAVLARRRDGRPCIRVRAARHRARLPAAAPRRRRLDALAARPPPPAAPVAVVGAVGGAARGVLGAPVPRRLSDALPDLGLPPPGVLLLVAVGRVAHRRRPPLPDRGGHRGRGCRGSGPEPQRP